MFKLFCNHKCEHTKPDDNAFKRGWEAGFASGMMKSWDSLLPIMTENLEKLKEKMREDAVQEAIARLRAPNKK